MKGFSKESSSIKAELDFLFPFLNSKQTNLSFENQLSLVIQHNIDYQVNIACKKFKELITKNKLTVIGSYYDFKNEFNFGYGRLIFTNVNKMKDKEQILNETSFLKAGKSIKNFYISRLVY